MSKNKKVSKKTLENVLPQNVVSIGDTTLQEKKVYFLQKDCNP